MAPREKLETKQTLTAVLLADSFTQVRCVKRELLWQCFGGAVSVIVSLFFLGGGCPFIIGQCSMQ
jgi:hypothetical protein